MHEYNEDLVYPPQDLLTKTNNKEYKKLALVFVLICLCATIMSFVLGFDWQEWLRWFMAGLFIMFGSFKLIGYEDFIKSFPEYNPIAKKIPVYNYIYPFIELFLGFLFAANLAPLFRDAVTIFIMSIGCIGILNVLSNTNRYIPWVYIDGIIRLPVSNFTLYKEVVMDVVAGIMLVSFFIFK